MMDVETAREQLLALPAVEEGDHFGKLSYRVKGKIFATVELETKQMVLKLTVAQQQALDENVALSPVEGRWGQLGWTYLELSAVSPSCFTELITIAWKNVTPKKLAKSLTSSENIR
ncbi:MAG: MmcQ/YjbR family DNA-binding protein [Spirosomataceae bacterium]